MSTPTILSPQLVQWSFSEPLGWINNIYRPVRKLPERWMTAGAQGKIPPLNRSAFHWFIIRKKSAFSVDLAGWKTGKPRGSMSLVNDVMRGNKFERWFQYSQSICPELVERNYHYPGSNWSLLSLSNLALRFGGKFPGLGAAPTTPNRVIIPLKNGRSITIQWNLIIHSSIYQNYLLPERRENAV